MYNKDLTSVVVSLSNRAYFAKNRFLLFCFLISG